MFGRVDICTIILTTALTSSACDEFLLNTTHYDYPENIVVSGRNMDSTWGVNWNLAAVTPNTTLSRFNPVAIEDTMITYINKYGFIGVAGEFNITGPGTIIPDNLIAITDGMNTEGLTVGVLWDRNTAGYLPYDTNGPELAVTVYDLSTYLLSMCKDIADVQALLDPTIMQVPFYLEVPAFLLVHLILHDAAGKSLVIEWDEPGKMTLTVDVPVLTNSPQLPAQLVNLEQALAADWDMTQVDALNITDYNYMYYPEARFLRLYYLNSLNRIMPWFEQTTAYPYTPNDGSVDRTAVLTTLDMLTANTIPWRYSHDGLYLGEGQEDRTQWQSVRDATNLVYYVRTIALPTLSKFDLTTTLKSLQNSAGDVRVINLGTATRAEGSWNIDRTSIWSE
ncbi:hypothetical protein SARC_05318 [Sphaeroforma arctica JP610]|uniref:Choloylglycine hydrolase/NAAA C-terminal domain-containing protein n=1 Tax=Sphaeroforma arctica JP610 TaxID=667725 RepID=A0A0L0G0M7_9EUKA|nr:hypothetical protein SARC_05318 [Sphaeroforma arctica JP610]KNC82391.1 hypothetical protein SARC_05318 [Sphaeroforma arctica JP610]|eukprot:XP_014156293.1 hypothetical protein SARC_05318 [Sphaeroforma arctica JP610]